MDKEKSRKVYEVINRAWQFVKNLKPLKTDADWQRIIDKVVEELTEGLDHTSPEGRFACDICGALIRYAEAISKEEEI